MLTSFWVMIVIITARFWNMSKSIFYDKKVHVKTIK